MLNPLKGVRAYALEQADRERRTCEVLKNKWAPIRAKASAYLKGENLEGLPGVVVVVDPDELRWTDSRCYEAEEIDNDMYQ